MMKKSIAVVAAMMIAAMSVASSALPAAAYTESQTASVDVYAASAKSDDVDEKAMEAALKVVKSRISIPAEFNEFSYTASKSNTVNTFRFTWQNKNYERYRVTIKGDIITQYSTPNSHSQTKASFAKLTVQQLEEKAAAWIAKVNPSMKGYLVTSSPTYISLTNDYVDIRYKRSVGGVDVSGNYANITVNKNTGEVASFSAGWWQDAEFSDPSKALKQDDIKKIYADEVTIKPWYRITYDNQLKKNVANIVYAPQDSFVYDAMTGKHSTMNDDYAELMDTDKYLDEGMGLDGEGGAVTEECDDAAAETAPELTEEEKAAVKEMEGLLTDKEFHALIKKDKYLGITSKYVMKSFNINKDSTRDCGYSISCNMLVNNKTDYCDINIEADAKTGEILSFYKSRSTSKTALDVTKANKLAEEAAKYYYGDIIGSYKADSSNTLPAVNSKNSKETVRSMTFYRYENNIQVTGNNIHIRVDGDGNVLSISKNHTEDVDFGDGKIISKSTALKKLFEQQDMELEFDGFTDLKSKAHTYLHYTMPSWYINAKTGKLCTYAGTAITEAESVPEKCPYTDIENSAKKEITTLYEYGVIIETGTQFQPNKNITVREMNMLISAVYGGYGYSPLYTTAYEDVEVDEEESDSDKPVTRAELAKAFADRAGYGSTAKFTSIFKSPYKDVTDKNQYIGYIAIADAIGAIDSDSDGNFRPDSLVTREYIYRCIYNYIVNGVE